MSTPTLKDLLSQYEGLIPEIEKAKKSGKSEGGATRSVKGKTVVSLARGLVRRAWEDIDGNSEDIKTSSDPVSVSLKSDYLKNTLKDERIAKYIHSHIREYVYKYRINVPVLIRGELILAIECRAYAENAMLKKILFDGLLIRERYPQATIVLFQLESQLGGDYSTVFADKIFGSPESHTIMSYFDYKLEIVTLLEGERNDKKPIHKKKFFKEMKMENLENACEFFKDKLRPFV